MRLLFLLIVFNLYSQKVIVSNDLTFTNNTFEGIRNYSSLMIGDKVFIGAETNNWKSISGILAQSSRVNDNISIYSGIRFKDKIRGYFINVNYNNDMCLCVEQKPIKYFIGLKSLTLRDIRSVIGIRYKIK